MRLVSPVFGIYEGLSYCFKNSILTLIQMSFVLYLLDICPL